jgi:multidrug efflux pump subunit AcrA (membrane-fusion protein)
LANGQVREKQVAVGLETSDRVEILSGLAEGEAVIVSEQTGGGQAPSFGGEGGFRMMMR